MCPSPARLKFTEFWQALGNKIFQRARPWGLVGSVFPLTVLILNVGRKIALYRFPIKLQLDITNNTVNFKYLPNYYCCMFLKFCLLPSFHPNHSLRNILQWTGFTLLWFLRPISFPPCFNLLFPAFMRQNYQPPDPSPSNFCPKPSVLPNEERQHSYY